MSTFLPFQPRPLVDISDLSVGFGNANPVVKGVSFSVARGECLALVGESGSGKSVTSRSLVGLAGEGAQIRARRLAFDGLDLLTLGERGLRQLRGGRIGFVMQDALGSLDPLRPVGREIHEPLQLHTDQDRHQRQARVIELLRSVGVPEPEWRARQYPHELSGGLRQRALIASAIACAPDLLIADEPTTALDATVQAQVLDLLKYLRGSHNAMLIISHDLAVVSRLADRVAVMHQGEIVEQGPVEQILHDPRHAYTQSLLSAARAVYLRRNRKPSLRAQSLSSISTPSSAAPVAGVPPILEARALDKAFTGPDARVRTAVSGVSLSLGAGETLGIVGESGSGKTTLTRLLLGLERPDAGQVLLRGRDWNGLNGRERRMEYRRIQVVFQDPLSSFDPRYTVARVLDEALSVAGVPRAAQREQALALLALVRLDGDLLSRRPIALSGGQRQRIAIARALAAKPDVLVCDEPVSALDVSVQAQILALLADLKQRLGLACLFISHDLGVIQQVSDRVMVMKGGQVVESGLVDEVFQNPQHAYTRTLLNAIPDIPELRNRHEEPRSTPAVPRPKRAVHAEAVAR